MEGFYLSKKVLRETESFIGLSACKILTLPLTDKVKLNIAMSINSIAKAKRPCSIYDLGNKQWAIKIHHMSLPSGKRFPWALPQKRPISEAIKCVPCR